MNTQNVPMIVVCDGIGGHNVGDVASAMALSHLGKRWEEESITDTEAAYQWLVKIFRPKMIVFSKSESIS